MTKAISFPVDDIIRKALARVGGEFSSEDEQSSARESLNLLLMDLTTRNAPLGSLKEYSVSVGTSDGSFSTELGVIGVLDVRIETSGKSTPLQSFGIFEYNKLNDRSLSGKPSQYTVVTSLDNLEIRTYPINNTTHRTLSYWGIVRPDTITNSRQSLDLNPIYYPAIIAGLAYHMSFERRNIDLNYRQTLKQEYEETLQRALDFERERTSIYVRPYIR
jgi:hypothetical protein